ncbi:2'-5' RNA ligase family protein [Saccharothrix variisporea]|uniref:2'-5' RNA ligase superfamily protein n=1 Tax=Saccharothrix variisporea TaxID=543527 RepID=A0A495XB03_9PSEU|nr:2'-5' RNA ligase family protein [Saccharothrix variisporea]RKT71177.1 2'-5' RNA ligase superfamily protein [Saccharothrix variisporea]
MHALVVFFDAEADAKVRELWRRIGSTFEYPPHLTFAIAGTIGPKVRAELREDLSRLWLPDLYLHTLGVFSTTENVLQLGAVVDGELLAVHSAIHDVLAGRVKDPYAYYLPGNWVPHCTLAHGMDDEELVKAFAAVHPVGTIRAKVREMSIVDTQTGEIDPLRKASTAPR